MTKYGKIYIEANSIEEAERELEMIKSLVRLGAIKGQGSTSTGKIEMEMRPTSANGYIAEAPSDNSCCGCCRNCSHSWDCADEELDDFYGTDDYDEVDEEISEILDELANCSPTAREMIATLLSNL